MPQFLKLDPALFRRLPAGRKAAAALAAYRAWDAAASLEQYVLTNDRDLYEFHRGWMEEAFTKYKDPE